MQKFFAERNDLVAAIFREIGDVRLCFRDVKSGTEPDIGVAFAHEALFPELVKGAMRLHPFLPQFLVGKRSHWKPRRLVCLHISIAGRIPGADVQFRCTVFCVDAVDAAGRAKLCRRVAVWTGNVGFFQTEILLCITQKEEGRVSVNSSLHRLTSTS